MMLLVAFSPFIGLGQIKIDDGSYTPKINNPKEAQIRPVVPAYSMFFEESTEKTKLSDCIVYVNLKRNDWAPYACTVNPVGESVFIPSNNYPERLFLNTKDKTAKMKSIPQGYYTIIGWFGKFEGSNELCYESINAHYKMMKDYTFENEAERKEAFKVEYSMYVLEDQEGNLYYDHHDEWGNGEGKESDERRQDKYVSETCYNKIKDLILDKEVVFEVPPYDFLTRQSLDNRRGKETFLCKDVFIRDGNMVGVFENVKGEITLKLEGYSCRYFNGIGYKGHVIANGGSGSGNAAGYTGGNRTIYPKEYEALSEQAHKLEKERAEVIAQERAREQQKAREQRRKEIIAKYGQKYGELISNGKVAVGMTKEMCREAIGFYPSNQYKATTASGTSEVWVYNVLNTRMTLYFDDGILYLIESKQ